MYSGNHTLLYLEIMPGLPSTTISPGPLIQVAVFTVSPADLHSWLFAKPPASALGSWRQPSCFNHSCNRRLGQQDTVGAGVHGARHAKEGTASALSTVATLGANPA